MKLTAIFPAKYCLSNKVYCVLFLSNTISFFVLLISVVIRSAIVAPWLVLRSMLDKIKVFSRTQTWRKTLEPFLMEVIKSNLLKLLKHRMRSLPLCDQCSIFWEKWEMRTVFVSLSSWFIFVFAALKLTPTGLLFRANQAQPRHSTGAGSQFVVLYLKRRGAAGPCQCVGTLN